MLNGAGVSELASDGSVDLPAALRPIMAAPTRPLGRTGRPPPHGADPPPRASSLEAVQAADVGDQPRMLRPPAKFVLGDLAAGRRIEGDEAREPAEVLL